MTHETRTEEEGAELSLPEAAEDLLGECRMVLPGIQALFGFQLIVVFNSAFDEKLSLASQRLHWVAIALVAIAVAMVMTPAALHRQRGSRSIDETFLTVSGRLLLLGMAPLAIGICLDFYLIGTLIVSDSLAGLSAGVLFVVFAALWFVLPRLWGRRRATGGAHHAGPRRAASARGDQRTSANLPTETTPADSSRTK